MIQSSVSGSDTSLENASWIVWNCPLILWSKLKRKGSQWWQRLFLKEPEQKRFSGRTQRSLRAILLLYLLMCGGVFCLPFSKEMIKVRYSRGLQKSEWIERKSTASKIGTESQFKIIRYLVKENKQSTSCSTSRRTSKLSSVELNCRTYCHGTSYMSSRNELWCDWIGSLKETKIDLLPSLKCNFQFTKSLSSGLPDSGGYTMTLLLYTHPVLNCHCRLKDADP